LDASTFQSDNRKWLQNRVRSGAQSSLVPAFAWLQLKSCAEMLARFVQAVALQIDQSQVIQRRIVSRIQRQSTLPMAFRADDSSLLEIDSTDQIIEVRRRLQHQGALKMRKGRFDLTFLYHNATQTVMSRIRIFLRLQSYSQIFFRLDVLSLVSSEQT